MNDFNKLINCRLLKFTNNLNIKYNVSLDINDYMINDQVRRCVNRVYDCGKNKTIDINRQCSRAVFVNNLCRQCACSDKETGNVNETPPEWMVAKYQKYIDKHPQEFKDRNIKNEINLNKCEIFMEKKSKKKGKIIQSETIDTCFNVHENEDTSNRNDINENKNKEYKMIIDLEDTTNRFDDEVKLNNGKVFYTIYFKNKQTEDLEIGRYSFIKIENISQQMKDYNIYKQIMDKNNFMIHPKTKEKCLQVEIFEHDYKNYSWLPKIYYECDYNSNTNKIIPNDCIYNKDYC